MKLIGQLHQGTWLPYITIFWLVFSLLVYPAHALEISIEPISPDIAEQSSIQVDIFADNATYLISMGAKISFDPSILSVVSATKNTDPLSGFVLDRDGNPLTTADQYSSPAVDIDNTNGSVTMIGGRMTGTSTTGLSGRVLLGSIIFQGNQVGTSDITVDLAKYHPVHPARTFDNFVNINGSVDEPTNLGSLTTITVLSDSDGDGVSVSDDCDDNDPNNWVSCASCVDSDTDTYFINCDAYVTIDGPDCNDSNPLEHPDQIWYVDNDGDGFGYYSLSKQQCTQPAGYVANDNDYDDNNGDIGAPVKIDRGSVYYYSSLQEAYNAAADDDTIRVIFVTLSGDFNANRNISVTLQGGYNGTYSTVSGDTVIQGIMDVSDGTITIENFILQ